MGDLSRGRRPRRLVLRRPSRECGRPARAQPPSGPVHLPRVGTGISRCESPVLVIATTGMLGQCPDGLIVWPPTRRKHDVASLDLHVRAAGMVKWRQEVEATRRPAIGAQCMDTAALVHDYGRQLFPTVVPPAEHLGTVLVESSDDRGLDHSASPGLSCGGPPWRARSARWPRSADHPPRAPAGQPHQVRLAAAGRQPLMGERVAEHVRVDLPMPACSARLGDDLVDAVGGDRAGMPEPQLRPVGVLSSATCSSWAAPSSRTRCQ